MRYEQGDKFNASWTNNEGSQWADPNHRLKLDKKTQWTAHNAHNASGFTYNFSFREPSHGPYLLPWGSDITVRKTTPLVFVSRSDKSELGRVELAAQKSRRVAQARWARQAPRLRRICGDYRALGGRIHGEEVHALEKELCSHAFDFVGLQHFEGGRCEANLA